MKLRFVHLLLLQSIMLLPSCSSQSKKSMDTSTEPVDAQVNVADSSVDEQQAISMIKDFYEAYAVSCLYQTIHFFNQLLGQILFLN